MLEKQFIEHTVTPAVLVNYSLAESLDDQNNLDRSIYYILLTLCIIYRNVNQAQEDDESVDSGYFTSGES
ncbi:hypothetical protein POVCU2_0019840 [Plasmodium ovale curtisi]|uniref:Uncharacterized protein n=1 Tax=Plasmodium ovale curtisi TaxID=864141 RepID=A0A1A8VV66_PLAOA|nr:hypothetical protein POVCU2_0019840 [Plasmodium ovale curtisi]SBT00796.1 hypothetical protein POVCU1_062410 [Plasmodium ovale curtisi]